MRIASAYPDPPFEVDRAERSGFDADWTRALCAELGEPWEPVFYEGDNFEGIFAGLGRDYDCVASGTTVTEHRRSLALFCAPYLRSGQSLVVNVERRPAVRSVRDLTGLTVGIQRGNTSDLIARTLDLGHIEYYAYRDIPKALDDLEAGRIDGVLKLAPVMHAMTRGRPALKVVQEGLSEELLAVCVALGDEARRQKIDEAQRALAKRGELRRLADRWLADSGVVLTL